jgi:hypothetical protein
VFGYALKVFSTIFFLARQHLDFLSGNSKYKSVGRLALNLARALARNNTLSKSMIKSKSKSKKKARRTDNSLLN